MILIVDSGATKAHWALVEQGKLLAIIESKGISPLYHSSDDIYTLVSETFSHKIDVDAVDRIFFYGAGCIKGHNTSIIESGILKYFENSEIDVQSDLIGAARALFGKEPGIACILGTGANSCKYDGSSIIERIPTLGFILGDECSGAFLGKMLINNYFKKIMPSDLAKEFDKEYKLDERQVLDKVYKESSPNRYLAGFTHFLKKHQEHEYVKNLLESSFQMFLSNNIVKYSDYQKYKLGIVGSVAFYFSEIFKKVAINNGFLINKIIHRPIDELIEYHF